MWQELEFWKVLNGRKIEHDRAEFIEEIYQITVRFLDDPLNGEVFTVWPIGFYCYLVRTNSSCWSIIYTLWSLVLSEYAQKKRN